MENNLGIGRLIAAAHRKAYQYAGVRLKGCSLEVGQFFFLRYVIKNQGISQEEMAHNLYLDKATISKGVKQLVGLGYIRKEANPNDRRRFHLYVNEKGLEMEEMLDAMHKEINDFVVKDLTQPEIEQLKSLLEKIV